jgi:flagellar biosynthesis protein FlhG
MNSKKRSGKGVEDISHLFLSGSVAAPAFNRMSPPARKFGEAVNLRTRVWLTLGLVPRLPSAFFTANLAVEMARCGRQVLVIETSPLPALDKVFGIAQIQPSLNDLLEQSQKQIVLDGPMGMKILSFRLCPEELRGFALEEQQILSQILRQEEEKAEQILIHAAYEENPSFEKWANLGQGVILSVNLNAETVLQTYQVVKYLYHLNPGLRIGVLGFGRQNKEGWAACMNKLSEAVTRFLGKTLEWYGVIPEDPLIDRSIAAKVPLALLDHTAQASVGFSMAVRNLQQEKGMASIRSAAARSFLDGLHRTAGLVEGK